jgi:hypothetical protein
LRDYTKVAPVLWQSHRFRDLPSDDARFLYVYLLTCQHQTSAGCYVLPDGYACADLNWPLKRYAEARQQLIKADLICFDPPYSVVLIKRWFKHNPPTSEDHVTGIERRLERLPSEELAQMALEALLESWEGVQETRGARVRKTVAGSPSSLGDGYTDRLLTTKPLTKIS